MPSDIRKLAKEKPESEIRVIVRVNSAISAAAAEFEKEGLAVRRRFSLIQAVAVQGKAGKLMSVLGRPWIEDVELDRVIGAKGA